MSLCWSIFLSLLVLCGTTKQILGECQTRKYEVPGDVMLTVIMSVRESVSQGRCNSISPEALSNIMAFDYSVDLLNGLDSEGRQFIPGVKLGYRILDDCGDAEIASYYAQSILKNQFPPSVVQCANQDVPYFAGVIGASRSFSTANVARILKDSVFPVITPWSTLAEFSNKTLYPNLLRTVHSDSLQIKVIISLIESLGWTRFVLIHTDDNYGTDGALSIQKLARQRNMCVSLIQKLPLRSGSVNSIFDSIAEQQVSYGGSIGVVFIGQREGTHAIITQAKSLESSPSSRELVRSIMWVFSESVGTNARILKEADFAADGLLSVSLVPAELTDFWQYFQRKLTMVNSTLVSEFKKTNCVIPDAKCYPFLQNDYVASVIDAVYALSYAVKDTHDRLCNNQQGICNEMKVEENSVLTTIKTTDINYSNMDVNFAPISFQRAKRSVKFDRNGDIVQGISEPLYQINMYWNSTFRKVGTYINKTELNFAKIRQRNIDGSERAAADLKRSTCQVTCQECEPKQSFIYIPGEVLIVAFFSIHVAPQDKAFGCGALRTLTNTIPALEASLYLFEQKLKSYDGRSFGLLVFDDCYNSLEAEQHLMDLLSGKTELIDERSNETINASSIVVLIGPEPSGVALPLAHSLTKIGIPLISYSASTPDLDERLLYPYFLRTVPSDKVQAKIMVQLVKRLNWKYVGIVYTSNNYGLKLMNEVVAFAAQEGICHGTPFPMAESPQEYELSEIIKNLISMKVKIVMFIGTQSSAKSLLTSLRVNRIRQFTFVASEDWGVNPRTIDGAEEEVLGSLTVTLDTARVVENNLRQYLLSKVPSEQDINPWFGDFWQEQFQCNLPWSFSKKVGRKECDLSQQRFSATDVQQMVDDQRIVHTMNSLEAAITGTISARNFLCSHSRSSEFICEKFRSNPSIVAKKIQEIKLFDGTNNFDPFCWNGNGNIGFLIHNLQRVDQSYTYKQVGKYSAGGSLELRKEDIQLYDNGQTRREIEDLNPACSVNCSKCAVALSNGHQSNNQTCTNSMQVAVLVIVCVLCFMVLTALLWICCQRRKQGNSNLLAEDYVSPRSFGVGVLVVENPSSASTKTTDRFDWNRTPGRSSTHSPSVGQDLCDELSVDEETASQNIQHQTNTWRQRTSANPNETFVKECTNCTDIQFI